MCVEEVHVVGLVAATEAWVLYVLLLVLLVQWLLLWLWLWLWHRTAEMCKGIREVVAWKPALVRRHRGSCLAIAASRVLGVVESVLVGATRAIAESGSASGSVAK
jgi:hypothetical protein